jgi:hypothetical protein
MIQRLLILLLLVFPACTAPPLRKTLTPAAAEPTWTAGRSVIRGLRDYAYASYSLRLAKDDPRLADESLQERLALARDALQRLLIEAGAAASDQEETELVRIALEGVQRSGRYAFVAKADDSFALYRIRDENTARSVKLFDSPFAYRLTVFDEALILDYPTYRSEKLGLPSQRKTATYSGDGTVHLDLATAKAIGERLFLPHIDSLKAADRLAQTDDAFVTLATKHPLADLVTLTKNALRWRSLEQLWSVIRSRPRADQVQRFVQDYSDRAELRAVAELREYGPITGDDPTRELTDAEHVLLFERGCLSAVIHGEPLGQVADFLALAALSLRLEEAEAERPPQLRAARQLVFEFAARLRKGEASPKADALAFAALARATPETLRALARQIYAKRS